MDYRKWNDPEIEDWEEDPNSRKKLYASDLWEFGLGCYPIDYCYWECCPNDSCCPRRTCWPRRGCWPRRQGCWPRQDCWPR